MDDRVIRTAIQRLAGNDRDSRAWNDLYRGLYPFLFATLFRIFRANGFLAEEAVQEVMIRLLRSFDFGTPSVTVASLMDYLKRTLRSVASDILSKEKWSERQEPLEGVDPSRFSSDWGSPETNVIFGDLFDKLKGDLSPRDGQVLEMLVAGYSVDRIAKSLNISNKRVYSMTSDLRRKVRSNLFPRPGKTAL